MIIIAELKELIKDLPNDMPFSILDLSTDDETEMNYSISKEDFEVIDCYEDDDYDNPPTKALFLTFENHLREEIQEYRNQE